MDKTRVKVLRKLLKQQLSFAIRAAVNGRTNDRLMFGIAIEHNLKKLERAAAAKCKLSNNGPNR